MYSVLLKLGVILPLGHTSLSGIYGRFSRALFEAEAAIQDMLVVMRLPDTDEHISDKELQDRTAEASEGSREVILKWKFDSAGAPDGFVERLIASCHRIGVVEKELCWRFGAFFKSHLVDDGERIYRFMIRHDTTEHVLSLTIIGLLDDERVWIAIRYVASAVIILSWEWPGVHWAGCSECSIHSPDDIYMATSHEVN